MPNIDNFERYATTPEARKQSLVDARAQFSDYDALSPNDFLRRMHALTVTGLAGRDIELALLEDKVHILLFMNSNLMKPGSRKPLTEEIIDQEFSRYTRERVKSRGVRLETFPIEPGSFRKLARYMPFGQGNNAPFQELYSKVYPVVRIPSFPAFASGQMVYHSPIFGVDEMMQRIEERYLTEREASLHSGSEAQYATALARYFLDGIGIVHPFQDGNDRPFRLIMEHEWEITGNRLDIPEDARGKVPQGSSLHPFPALYNLCAAQLMNLDIFDGTGHMQALMSLDRTRYYAGQSERINGYLSAATQPPVLADLVAGFASGLRSYSR